MPRLERQFRATPRWKALNLSFPTRYGKPMYDKPMYDKMQRLSAVGDSSSAQSLKTSSAHVQKGAQK